MLYLIFVYSVRAKKHNIAYVYAVVAVLVATALSVTMFAVYRTRIRKNKHHKMPFVCNVLLGSLALVSGQPVVVLVLCHAISTAN